MNAPDRYERFVVPEGTKNLGFHMRGTPRSSMRPPSPSSARTTRSETSSGCEHPLPLLTCLCAPHQIQTTSQSSPTQAYNQAIDDLDKELDYLKKGFEVCCSPLHVV
ncbi:hypothetical protein BHE74_00004787 [Ensete ventricosum]|nr:hypothetical protein GW17_00036154 [Ensete ventricosum]RWW86440.1 hypothetical protein BHE74_00004787 [Ensete ventricosum]RZR83232.1 hypothetical protein BHM03_00009801 [Ensete ventricosum]